MHIELVHFFCHNCQTEIFMDKKTAEKREKRIKTCICDECYHNYKLKRKIKDEKSEKEQ